MKRLVIAVSALLTLSLSLESCTCDCSQCPNSGKTITYDAISGSLQREAIQTENISLKNNLAQTLKKDIKNLPLIGTFAYKKGDAGNSDPQPISADKPKTDAAQDAAFIQSLFSQLVVAEDKKNLLDVEVMISEKPIEDGVFVFSIKAQEAQNVQIQLYDEEGFGLSANNQIKIANGNNYRALNLKNMEAGMYLLKLRNMEDGRELMRRVHIKGQTTK